VQSIALWLPLQLSLLAGGKTGKKGKREKRRKGIKEEGKEIKSPRRHARIPPNLCRRRKGEKRGKGREKGKGELREGKKSAGRFYLGLPANTLRQKKGERGNFRGKTRKGTEIPERGFSFCLARW